MQSRTNCTTTVPRIQVHNRISGATGSSHLTRSSGRTVRPRNQGIRLQKGKRRLDSRPFSSQRSTAHIHETRGFGYNSNRVCTAITRDSASSPTRQHGVLGMHRRNWCRAAFQGSQGCQVRYWYWSAITSSGGIGHYYIHEGGQQHVIQRRRGFGNRSSDWEDQSLVEHRCSCHISRGAVKESPQRRIDDSSRRRSTTMTSR